MNGPSMNHGHGGLNSHQSMVEMVNEQVVNHLKIIGKELIKQEDSTFRILDLGCGDGGLTNQIRSSLRESDDLIEYNTVVDIVGIDFNEELILRANQNLGSSDSASTSVNSSSKNKVTLRFAQGDATTFTLPEKVDCIVSNAVLHHISSDHTSQTIQRMSDTLNDNGGIVIIELAGKGNLYPIFDIYKSVVLEIYGELYYGSLLCPEYYLPSISELTTILEQNNIEVTYANLYYHNRILPFTSSDDNEVKQWLYTFGKATNILPPSLFLQPNHEKIIDSILNRIQSDLKQTSIYDNDKQQLIIPHRRLRIVGQKNAFKQSDVTKSETS